ncbi:ZIP family metal transporter, partial [Parvularcula oceani]|uniref:ZIP family metal transporter n=1 Tax=Parvularcula oceani TaxID=1247963 RepID=UPI00068F1B57
MPDLIVQMPPAVLASLIAAVIATLGVAAVLLRGDWAVRHSGYFTAFAAGVLVTTAVTLFPEALRASAYAPLGALAGYGALFAINALFRRSAGAALAPVVAIGLHSFIDGLEYGILFEHDGRLGQVASIGLIAHEFAEGVILFALLRQAGVRTNISLLGALAGAALTTPLGAISSQFVLSGMTEGTIGLLLGLASGALFYVGSTHLPMRLPRKGRRRLMAFYAAGIVLALSLSLGHGGGHHEDELPGAAGGGADGAPFVRAAPGAPSAVRAG